MSDSTKMNLEELRKSFPALDDFSKEKLLGGDYWNPNWASSAVGGGYFVRMPPGNDWGPNDWFSNQGTSQSSSSRPTGGGGYAYFGDTDDWDDSYGDMGGDSWGDGDPGGDSNPGGSEGGNGQNSSGNPGTGQPTPDYSNLEFINTGHTSVFASRTYNNTSEILYGKPDHDTPYDRVIVPPGGFTDVPLDAFKVGGYVYKVTDGYGTLTVTDSFYSTMYSDESILFFDSDLERMQEWLQDHGNPCERTDFLPDDHQWDNIFDPP